MPAIGGCCCTGVTCDDVEIPSTMVFTMAGLDAACTYPTTPPCTSTIAPLENKAYTLNRYHYSDETCNDTGLGVGACLGCFRYGTLSLCDIADLYAVAVDVSCGTCPEAFGLPCDSESGAYKFLDTINCGVGVGLIDVYLSIWACVSFELGSASSILRVQFIYVSDPTGTPILQYGGGIYGFALLYPNSPFGCNLGGNTTCCNITGAIQGACGGGLSDGLALLTLSGSPTFTGNDTGSCCGNTTITLAAG